MAYCAIEDVELILKGVSGDLPAAADKLDDAQIQQSIDDAGKEVDLALSNFYVTPVVTEHEPTIEVLKHITANIAAYLADLTFRMSKEYGSGANPLRLRYTRARALLNGILEGKYRLMVPEVDLQTGTSVVINPYEGDLITLEHLFGQAVYG